MIETFLNKNPKEKTMNNDIIIFVPLEMQPVLSPSVLAEIMRPDGSSTIPVPGGESLSAELAHEIMSIQVIVMRKRICFLIQFLGLIVLKSFVFTLVGGARKSSSLAYF